MKNELMGSARSAVKHWWISLIIGLLALGVGVWCIFKPLEALVALTILFVISFLISGMLEIIFALANKDSLHGWGWTLTSGIVDLLIGILLLWIPVETPLVMIYFVGFWIMFQSVWAIGMSVDLQRIRLRGWGWLLALAIIGLLFSFVFIVSPQFGGGFIVALMSVSFIIYGAFRIYLSFRLKSIKDKLDEIEE